MSATPSHSLASAGASRCSVNVGQILASSAFNLIKCSCPVGTSSSGKMACAGHSGSHNVQSIHSSGSMTIKFGPTLKQSTGQTSTQSVYLHLMQFSVTTNGMELSCKTGQNGAPYEFRTRVPALRGQCPRPLDEGSKLSARRITATSMTAQ